MWLLHLMIISVKSGIYSHNIALACALKVRPVSDGVMRYSGFRELVRFLKIWPIFTKLSWSGRTSALKAHTTWDNKQRTIFRLWLLPSWISKTRCSACNIWPNFPSFEEMFIMTSVYSTSEDAPWPFPRLSLPPSWIWRNWCTFLLCD